MINRYLVILLRALRLFFADQGAGAAQPNISKIKIVNTVIPLPPLPEQKRIVAKVDELMKRCDELENRQKDRAARHKTLVASCLNAVTDPKKAKTSLPSVALAEEGSFNLLFSSPESVTELRKTILQLAVQGSLTGQSASFGEWRILNMREACILITDGEHATPQRIAEGIPLATAKNIRDGFLDMTNTDFVSAATAQKCWRRCRPCHDDILMVCVGATTGRVCRVQHPPEMVLVRSVALIRPKQDCITPSFLELFLRSPNGQLQIWSKVKQSAQPCLYLGRMGDFIISLPSLADQKRIVSRVSELMAMCDNLEAKLNQSSAVAEKLAGTVVNHMSL